MRTINFADIKDNSQVYVKSAAGGGKMAGDVNIDLREKDGNRMLVVVPKTFIPINVTNFAPTSMFMESPSFRKLVASGVLTLIHPEDAEKELSTKAGAAEFERLRKEIYSGVNFDNKDGVSALEAVNNLSTSKVGLRVKDIMMRTDIEDEEKLSLLRAEEPDMTKEEVDFILGTVAETSEISKWASDLNESRFGD